MNCTKIIVLREEIIIDSARTWFCARNNRNETPPKLTSTLFLLIWYIVNLQKNKRTAKRGEKNTLSCSDGSNIASKTSRRQRKRLNLKSEKKT